MNLTNIKKMRSERGFTIVELLIVIVVIGILAAIVIVTYSGVQNRARTTKNQTSAIAVQKAAEAYNADLGYYPPTFTILKNINNLIFVPTTITLVSAAGAGTTGVAVTAANGTTSIEYDIFGPVGTPTGARIKYWDFTTGAASLNIIYLGNATVLSSCTLTPA